MSERPDTAAHPFDVGTFLAQPLVARVATAAPEPSVRPVWYLWEDGCFWWLTGDWSQLPGIVARHPRVALVVDTCDLGTGLTRQVSARGPAEVTGFDRERTYRKLSRYLGPDPTTWEPRFSAYLDDVDGRLVRLAPDRLVADDFSFRPSGARPIPVKGPRPSPARPCAHLALVGATASGKSALALALSRTDATLEVLSVDAMGVYRGMDIGTAKPSASDRADVPHHLLDLADPWEDFSVARFQAAARSALAGVEARGHRALLVGGTGLYIRAVIDNLTLPGRYPEARAEAEAVPDTAALHRRLAELDPVAAGRMEPTNRRRLVRALEVTVGSGHPFSSFGPGLGTYPASPVTQVGLRLPVELLDARIDARIDAMLAAGLLVEVQGLIADGHGLSSTARQALGYRELADHLEGRCSYDEAVAEIRRRTRRFARRQMRWFRRDPRITWLDVYDNPLDLAPRLLGDWALR